MSFSVEIYSYHQWWPVTEFETEAEAEAAAGDWRVSLGHQYRVVEVVPPPPPEPTADEAVAAVVAMLRAAVPPPPSVYGTEVARLADAIERGDWRAYLPAGEEGGT